MKKFMAMYMAPATVIEQWMKATPAEAKAGMDEWANWAKSAKNMADLGAPLGKTMRVTSSGTSPTKNEITGYSVIEGDSFESVAKSLKGHPHLKTPGTSIDLLEVMSMPGM